MKSLKVKFLFISVLLLGLSYTFAQKEVHPPTKKTLTSEERQAKKAEFQEKLISAQIEEINKRLKLDNATASKFEKIYRDYVTELSKYRNDSRKDMPKKSKNMNKEDADKYIKQRFEREKGIIDLQEKYYSRFKTVLSADQILTVYETQRETQHKIEKEHRHRMEKDKKEHQKK